MRRIILIAILLVLSLACKVEDKKNQLLQLTIKSDKKVYKVGEETKFTIEIKNIGKTLYRGQAELMEGRSVDGQFVKGLLNLGIYGVDEEDNAIYRLRLPDVSNKYFATWPDLVLRAGESYVQVISLNDAPIIRTYDQALIGDGKLFPGQHRLFASRSIQTMTDTLPSILTSNTITIDVVEKKSITEEDNSSRSQSINDTLKNKEWNKVVKYRNNADITFIFRNWDDILLGGPEIVTGKLVTMESQKVENFENILNTFKENKELAVVIIGHKCFDYLLEKEFELKIDRVKEIIKKYGFQKVVFLGELAVGPGFIIKE